LTRSSSALEFVPFDRVYGQGIEDMLHRIPSTRKIHATVGWQPSRGLDEILADVIEHARHAPVIALET
jgi:UDP-glucose 4-epimerase